MSLATRIRSHLSLKVSLALVSLLSILILVAAWIISSREMKAMQDLTLEKAKLAATIGARAYGSTLENAVDNAYVTINQLFEQRYEEIKGYDWGGVPRYHTAYDFFTDHSVQVLQDQFLSSEDFIYALGTDVNGYGPTHNAIFQAPLTGDPKKDLAGNRTKRKFEDEVGLKAARNTAPHLVQLYQRDTGAMMWDVSSPIEVKGKHWGCFRIGVSIDKIRSYQMQLLTTFLTIFAILTGVAAFVVFLMVKRAIHPLEKLSELADQISIGEKLDEHIVPTSTDEVGRMAKSLDRLRASLRAAMSRLGE